MTPNKPKDYTVSECQILKWLELDYSVRDIATEIRSGTRPVSIPQEGAAPLCEPGKPYGVPSHPAARICEECRAQCHAYKCCILWDCPIREEIAQAAREKVLDEIGQFLKNHDCWKSDRGNYWTPVPFPASALM